MTIGARSCWRAPSSALLAVLLLHRQELVSSDRLIEELWGEPAPASASKALQVHVSRLRRALNDADAPSRLITVAGGYCLRLEAGECDRDRAEDLIEEARAALAEGSADRAATMFAAALELWRGEPLADLAYESIAQAEISSLQELRLLALEGRIQAQLASRAHAQLIPSSACSSSTPTGSGLPVS